MGKKFLALLIFSYLIVKGYSQYRSSRYRSSCRDNHRNCASWASMGKCKKNPRYMLVNCKKSCKQCTVSTSHQSSRSCQDRNSQCYRYKSKCQISDANWKRWVRDNCPKTCGICGSTNPAPRPRPQPGPEPTSHCSDTNKEWTKVCATYKLYNWCRASGYRRVTEMHCQKTCGFCTPIVEPSVTITPTEEREIGKRRTCGRDKFAIMGRLIGGTDATPHRWEWQGGIYYRDFLGKLEFVCGGSLISRNALLTAAHCVQSRRDETKMVVKLGDDHRTKNEDGEQIFRVKKIIIHEKWTPKGTHNDIAILQLERSAKYTDTVGTVCVASRDINPSSNPTCFITGWGKTGVDDPASNILQEAQLPMLSNSVCNKRNKRVTSKMLCGGFTKDNGIISGCMGDSGGPYVCKSQGRWVLHGIMSWGSRYCDAQHFHTVFTRVSKYNRWITDRLRSL